MGLAVFIVRRPRENHRSPCRCLSVGARYNGQALREYAAGRGARASGKAKMTDHSRPLREEVIDIARELRTVIRAHYGYASGDASLSVKEFPLALCPAVEVVQELCFHIPDHTVSHLAILLRTHIWIFAEYYSSVEEFKRKTAHRVALLTTASTLFDTGMASE